MKNTATTGVPAPPRNYTTAQACERFAISKPTWYRWLRMYRIKRLRSKTGRIVRYPAEELDRLERELTGTIRR